MPTVESYSQTFQNGMRHSQKHCKPYASILNTFSRCTSLLPEFQHILNISNKGNPDLLKVDLHSHHACLFLQGLATIPVVEKRMSQNKARHVLFLLFRIYSISVVRRKQVHNRVSATYEVSQSALILQIRAFL